MNSFSQYGKSATTSIARGYEDGPWKGPGLPLLVAADFTSVSREPK